MNKNITKLQNELSHHPLFSELKTVNNIRIFMQQHVWAVWDFMSLVKRLQRDFTCVDLPWKPVGNANLSRFINQIVLGEESDLDEEGKPCSHFELYLAAMSEIGADTSLIKKFLNEGDLKLIPLSARFFCEHNLSLAQSASTVSVFGAFLFGREKLIPQMFTELLNTFEGSHLPIKKLKYYFIRHIALDGDEHGPLGEKSLTEFCHQDTKLLQDAQLAGEAALKIRKRLWDETLKLIKNDTWDLPQTHQPQVSSLY